MIPILVAILRDSLENPQATSAITSTLKSFSTFASNARQIIASGASELLVTVLTNDFNVPAVHTAIEVLWNCLENENSAKTVLASWHTLVRDLLYPYTCALRSRSLLSVSVCTTLLAVSITLCCRSLLSVCSFGVGDRTHSKSCSSECLCTGTQSNTKRHEGASSPTQLSKCAFGSTPWSCCFYTDRACNEYRLNTDCVPITPLTLLHDSSSDSTTRFSSDVIRFSSTNTLLIVYLLLQ